MAKSKKFKDKLESAIRNMEEHEKEVKKLTKTHDPKERS